MSQEFHFSFRHKYISLFIVMKLHVNTTKFLQVLLLRARTDEPLCGREASQTRTNELPYGTTEKRFRIIYATAQICHKTVRTRAVWNPYISF